MTSRDARERARGAIIRIHDIIEATAWKNEQHTAVDSAVAEFDLQWRAAKREDEQRIAALVEAVIWMSGSADFAPGGQAHEHWVGIRDGVLARALAGSEESGDDEQRSDAASL